MSEETKEEQQATTTILNNSVLLQFEGFIRFISGFLRGMEAVEKVNSNVVVDCLGEMLEFLNQSKEQIVALFKHCESIMEENEQLLEEVKRLNEELERCNIPMIEEKQEEALIDVE